MAKRELTEQSLKARLARLGPLSDDQQKHVVCSIVGHSRIQTTFFGYYSCGRCGDQLGDSLGSLYPQAASVVVVGHNCPTCRTNAETLTWRDTFMAPDPFPDTAIPANV